MQLTVMLLGSESYVPERFLAASIVQSGFFLVLCCRFMVIVLKLC